MTGTEHLLPVAYDVAWSASVLGHGLLLAAALVRWLRVRRADGGGLLELLVVVLVPVLGPAAYLLARRGDDRRTRASGGRSVAGSGRTAQAPGCRPSRRGAHDPGAFGRTRRLG